LPADFKVLGRQTKRVLKAAFAKELPVEVLTRKKAGFPVPYEGWLVNGLRDYVEDTLLSERAKSRGYFRKEEIARLLRTNNNRRNSSKEIFCLLVIELWQHAFADHAGSK
jgi:asparagine synthase (glutamine-hydrolysing)